MDLADSMHSQDNINKVVSQEREYNLLPMDRIIDISVRRKDKKITGKNRKYVSSDNQP